MLSNITYGLSRWFVLISQNVIHWNSLIYICFCVSIGAHCPSIIDQFVFMFEVTYHESREWRDCMNWRPDQFLWIFDVLPFVFALEFSGIFWKFCIFVLIFYVETIWWLLQMSWTWFHWCRDKISGIVCRYLLLLQNKQLSMTGISHLVANQLNSVSYTVFRLIFWSYLICYCGHWQLFSCYSCNFLLLRSVHDQFLELVDVEFACGWCLIPSLYQHSR